MLQLHSLATGFCWACEPSSYRRPGTSSSSTRWRRRSFRCCDCARQGLCSVQPGASRISCIGRAYGWKDGCRNNTTGYGRSTFRSLEHSTLCGVIHRVCTLRHNQSSSWNNHTIRRIMQCTETPLLLTVGVFIQLGGIAGTSKAPQNQVTLPTAFAFWRR